MTVIYHRHLVNSYIYLISFNLFSFTFNLYVFQTFVLLHLLENQNTLHFLLLLLSFFRNTGKSGP